MTEFEHKLQQIRAVLETTRLSGIVFRSSAWFAWATCGGSNAVLLTTDSGVAEVLVTPNGAWILTDEIEAERLAQEEIPVGFEWLIHPWADVKAGGKFIREMASDLIASDMPRSGEIELPPQLAVLQASLHPAELERYRVLGRDAACAMTDVLLEAKPTWTGYQLAGAASERLWGMGIHPALTLVGDEARLPLYRHSTAHSNPIGSRAMLVFCARRHGLYANLTRFVYFRKPSKLELKMNSDVMQIEAEVLAASRVGASLGSVYQKLVAAYQNSGHEHGENKHHQGGTCGYGARDAIALPDSRVQIREHNAVAWNPSLVGAKIEDTMVVSSTGIEVLTTDSRWENTTINGILRPNLLLR